MILDRKAIDELTNGAENQEAILLAKSIIEAKRGILFAGAGTSKPAGYPLWDGLLSDLVKIIEDQGHDTSSISLSGDLLIAAEQIYNKFDDLKQKDLLLSTLHSKFAPKSGQSLKLQRDLLSLPFCGIVTTNYDRCFEIALHELDADRRQTTPLFLSEKTRTHVRDFFDSLKKHDDRLCVAHLHGYYDQPDELILTKSQYQKAYGTTLPDSTASKIAATEKWTLLRKSVWALMATQRLFFVGFGMKDPYITALMDYVGGDLWDKNHKTHFLITSIYENMNLDADTFKRNLLYNLGVETIFYEAIGGDHSLLTSLLEQLGATTSAPGKVSRLLGPPT